MTMFDFMANAFYLLCGIVCVALAVLAVYALLCTAAAIIRTAIVRAERRRKHGARNQN